MEVALATYVPQPAVQPSRNRKRLDEANSIQQLFEAQVERTPDAVAVVADAGTTEQQAKSQAALTYAELNVRANQLAHYLQTLGVGQSPGAETFVGLCVERSLEMVIGILAILKAGGVYLPLDPSYPRERLAFMLQDAKVALLLTQQHLQDHLPTTSAQRIDLDHDWPQIAHQPCTNPISVVQPDHLAYVIYTSGSTGQPKGVLIEHGGLCNLAAVQKQTFGLQPGQRVLQFASLNFDASVWEIFMALCAGATLYVAPAAALQPGPVLTDFLVKHAITHITLIPSALAALAPEEVPELQTVIVAGEACPAALARRWQRGRRFFNAYGPTEATVCATIMECTEATNFTNTPPIGKPIANVQVYLLDEQGNPVVPGTAGELMIGGSILARGYLNRPALTAERFTVNPFGAGRLYKTGDLARWQPDGTLQFLGRSDHQVKIRGFRIELGEIEANLAEHPQVQTTVVVAQKAASGTPQLVAYVVMDDTAAADELTIRAELRRFLQTKLPDYMLPAAVVILPALPLMPNGKVDRNALPAPADSAFTTAAFVPPQTPTEEKLAAIWRELLGLHAIGRATHFFESGGHSLLATQVLARVRAEVGLALPLHTFFEAPTLAALGAVIDQQRQQDDPFLPPKIQAGARPTTLPLSYAQQRLWFLAQMEGASATYNLPLPLRLCGPLDGCALKAALQAIVDRHEVLRTTFPAVNGVAHQVIAPALTLALPVVDIQGAPACDRTEQNAALQQHLQEAAWQPFDLATGPLLRATLYRLQASEHVLLLIFHHIIMDGWSMGRLLQELDFYYRAYGTGTSERLPPLPLQYADFTLWQREWLQGAALAQQRAYWQAQLANAPTLLTLPTDFPRPPVQTFRGGVVDFLLDAEPTAALQRLSQQQGVTPFMVVYAAFAVLLARYSGQRDLVIGATVANRQQRELEPLIGFFVNTLPLRADLSGNPTVADLLTRVWQMTLAAYAHQEIPFEQLVSDLQVERSLHHSPLCQVMLTFDNTTGHTGTVGGLTATPVALASMVAKFDLTLSLTAHATTIAASLEYNRDLFLPATIERMAGHFQVLLTAMFANPTLPIAQLPLLTAAERQQLLVTWNQTQTPYPRDKTIQQLFQAQAARTPAAVAVVFATPPQPSPLGGGSHSRDGEASVPLPTWGRGGGGDTLTYGELNACANQLAHYLRGLGVGSPQGVGTLVGLCVERSPLMIVGILGILKAGGAYVPLDPTYPQERLSLMVEDTAMPLILTQATLRARLPQTGQTLCLDTEWPLVAEQPTTNLAVNATAENLAYVMYTSGSTGRPKGVCVTHRNVVRLVQNTNYADLTAAEIFLQLASMGFDAATFEIWGALLNGARLVVMAPGQPSLAAIDAAIRQHGVTTVLMTSGPFHLLVDEQIDALRPVRQLLAGGDVLSMPHVRRVLQKYPACRLINVYGPTENATFTCCYTFPHDIADLPNGADTMSAPIGPPVANTQVYLLDEMLQPVPIGVPGELYAGGDGVAPGYLNRPELTATRFIDNPFGSGKLYKTGDLARWLPSGDIEFLGRLDQQVKIRGFRIELGEIEAVLRQHPAVREAVVLVQQAASTVAHGDKRLVAYVVTEEQRTAEQRTDGKVIKDQNVTSAPPHLGTPWDTAAALSVSLRTFLQTQVPDYMVPAVFVPLAALPLTPNGKIDRQALPKPDQAPLTIAETFVPPQTPTEEVLAAIWANVLAVPQVGRHDNFFQSGGHSLLATQIVARVRASFAVDVGVRTLFEAPTIAELGQVIAQRRLVEQGVFPSPMLGSAASAARPTPLPLSYAQQRLWFLDQLEGANAIYNIPLALRLSGPPDVNALYKALNTIIQRHEILRTSFPAVNGVAQQAIAVALHLPLPIVDLPAAMLQQRLQETAWQPFDLAVEPLLRATLYRLTATEHVLALTFHHIIADGWSLAIFLDELALFYGGYYKDDPALTNALGSALPLQYADFTLWQREWLQGVVLARQQAYWRQQLAQAPTLLTLPTDAPRPPVQTFNGGTVQQSLDANLTAALHQLSQQQGVSLFMTLYAAFAVLLSRYSGQEDLVIGAPIANRHHHELEPLIGFFVNTLPLRADLSGNPGFDELLQRVCRMTLDAYTHQDLPFEQIVSDLGIVRSLSHAPLFQVMLAFNNTDSPRQPFVDLTVTPLALENVVARFDLTLHISEEAGRLQTAWEYNRDLFTPATIARMAGHFQVLLTAILANPTLPIAQLPLLTAAECQQLLVTWNQTQTPYPRDKTIHQLFEAQAAHTSAAVAVVFATPPQLSPDWGGHPLRNGEVSVPPQSWGRIGGGDMFTYAELNARANQLAHYLRGLGVGPGILVGLCVERSPLMVVGILGILKAGSAYVPLDPSYPQERLTLMVEGTGMRVVVTQQHLAERFLHAAGQPLCLDRDWAQISRMSTQDLPCLVQPTDLAYVIYTSGSTGRPKGVMVTHQNLVHSTTARFHYYAQPVGRFLLLSSFAFDSSVAGIFWTLCQGGALILPQPDDEKDLQRLAGLIRDYGITHLLCLPSLYSLLLTYSAPEQLSSLQVVIVAGEACPATLPEQHTTTLPGATLYNEYGPTEGTVWSTVYQLPAHWVGTTVPIGKLPEGALANIQLYLLDRHRQPVPIGVPGELYIGGDGITPGYLNQLELTAEKFIANPFRTETPDAKLYRTGDLVRYLPDGHLQFLGRVDQQVKLRGFRIELGEITSMLLQHPQVQDAVVIIHTDEHGQQRLVAYVVTDKMGSRQEDKETLFPSSSLPLFLSALRTFMQAKVPDYMVPAVFVPLAALPLTPNGKVDRHALPDPQTAQAGLTTHIAPRTDLETKLAAIWQTLLGVTEVSVHDDFFALGGHSLLLAQLAAQIRLNFQTVLSLRTLFQAPTLAAMSAAIAAATRQETMNRPSLVKIRQPASPYLQYEAHPLDLAIKSGKLPPVNAAALAYWPDELLDKHGLSRAALTEGVFQGRATVASILETQWGRIAAILLPRLHSELYVDPTLVDAIGAALALAGEIGAQSVSLTGLLPSATEYGQTIIRMLGDRPELPRVTTGHAMTATAVVLNVEKILHAAGRSLTQERVACLGLGSIGLTSLRLLLQVAPHPQTIMLCDLASKTQQLQAIGAQLIEQFGFQGDLQIIPVQREMPPAIYKASLIVGATNVPDVLAVEKLPPGVLLVDDSGPHCFDATHAIARFQQQHDLLFSEGGIVRLPTPIGQTFYTPPALETIFADSALDDPQIMTGCVLSSLLSTQLSSHWTALPPTIGTVPPALALAYYRTIQALGIHAPPLHCAGYRLAPADIAQFRQSNAVGWPHDTLDL